MDYQHIHPDFRHIMLLSDHERIEFMEMPRWIGNKSAQQILDTLQGLMNKPIRPRMPNLLIIGDSNNGKTTIIDRFKELCGQGYIDENTDPIKPVIVAESPPSADEKGLYISILEQFYAPYRASDPASKLRYQVIHLLRMCKTKILVICKICLEQGKVICTKCSQPMPAGYGKSCEACYWQGLLDKRTYINCSAFTSPKMEIHFREFASWLGVKVGTHKAAITLNRYLSLFLDIENKLTGISSYEAMLNSFGAAKLRKYLLPMKWMEESGLIVVDAIAREANTERCRIESLLNKLEAKSKQRQLADGYYQLLKTDLAHNKTTIRSIRLALSPAIHLMLQGAKMSIPIPNQKLLDNYLSKSVGQRSSISGFVCYLRDRQGIEIKLPKLDANKALLNRRRKLESEILALMKADKANAHNREWLCVALEYFHGMPKRVGKTIASENLIYTADGGVVVCWNGLRYWLKAS